VEQKVAFPVILITRDHHTDLDPAVLKLVGSEDLTGDIVIDLSKIVQVIETSMDGTSGALYSIYLNSLVHSLRQSSSASSSSSLPQIFATALSSASKSLSNYTPAQPGDRTLIDALHPFVETLKESGDVKKAAQAARKGAEGTKGMKASLGRTVYVGGKGFEEVPDPGAWGLSEFFLGLAGITAEESEYEVV